MTPFCSGERIGCFALSEPGWTTADFITYCNKCYEDLKWSLHLTEQIKQLAYRHLKHSGAFTRIQTHELCDAGAMLYQLSYEATQLEAGQFVGFPRKDSVSHTTNICISFNNSVMFFQLRAEIIIFWFVLKACSASILSSHHVDLHVPPRWQFSPLPKLPVLCFRNSRWLPKILGRIMLSP